jgi:hypothetical protein
MFKRLEKTESSSMRSRVLAGATALFASLSVANADTDSLTYSIYVYGFKLGVLQVEVAQTPARYAAAGRVTTTGLLARVANFRFDGKVRGYKEGPNYWPEDYTATITRKSNESNVHMTYRDRIPKVVERVPDREQRPTDVDPAKQKGAVDLISSAYMILRDVPPDELCDKSVQMFDGRRRSQIQQAAPAISGEKARCAGFYQRIAGFTAGEMADQTVFPFTLYYEMQQDGNYRLVSVETQSVVGSAKLVRRD